MLRCYNDSYHMNAYTTKSEWKQAILNSEVAGSAWDRVSLHIIKTFSSLPSLVAVSSFPTSASERSQYIPPLYQILALIARL